MKHNKVLDMISDPEELEKLYRNEPKKFKQWLLEAVEHRPDSETLHVWQARLEYKCKSHDLI